MKTLISGPDNADKTRIVQSWAILLREASIIGGH
jgi:hypothetical protein